MDAGWLQYRDIALFKFLFPRQVNSREFLLEITKLTEVKMKLIRKMLNAMSETVPMNEMTDAPFSPLLPDKFAPGLEAAGRCVSEDVQRR